MRRFFQTALIVSLAALFLPSCSTNRIPRYNNDTGEPEQFKRYTGRPMVDYIWRWNQQAFFPFDEDEDVMPSEDVLDVLKRHGKPDYVRNDVRADRNEIYDEWVYWDRNLLIQFIAGDLVYEGVLTDSDRTLVERGYPTKAFAQQYETGPYREIWIYDNSITLSNLTLSFSDGQMVYRSEY